MLRQIKKGLNGLKIEKGHFYKGVVLHDYEIEVLRHIYLHKQLRATSLHELYRLLSNKKIETSNISNRLKKLLDAGVVARNEELIHDMSKNFVRYSYRLNSAGLEVLVFLNIIRKESIKTYKTNAHINKFPNLHSKVASTITNKIVMDLIKQEITFDFCRGNNHYLLGNDSYTRKTETTGFIIPDYVIETRDTIVPIEIDTGTQRAHIIKQKIEKYIVQARSKEFNLRNIHVVFIVVDNSISDTFETNRNRRVYSLKATFLSGFDLPGNLHFYAVNALHSIPLISYILNPKNNLEEIEKDFICEDFMELYNERYKQHFIQVEKPAVAKDLFHAVYTYEVNTIKYDVYLIYRVVGNLRDYQKSESALSYLSKRLERNKRFILLYVYDNATSALADVTTATDASITIAASYLPTEDNEDLVVYKHTSLLTKKAVKGVIEY
ncbi:hypothetical protein DEX24_16625 [Kurthia sibirica]|uniref:Replication-relaxation family protein n=1 Tax=Kurthia sibirica TaxID=202750 RepID=A0A2U3AEE3_9BACL|nr:hypothetical protein DEX24_16625 [Kurthia sibirica]